MVIYFPKFIIISRFTPVNMHFEGIFRIFIMKALKYFEKVLFDCSTLIL